MNEARIDLLKTYIKEEPNDPFNYYGLACEYMHEEPDEALKLFETLLADHKDYLPTYYQAAQLLVSFEKNEAAVAVYEKGIALAKVQNNAKAIKELSAALQNLLFEME